MSLINQMLKELDARSSEVDGISAAYGGQIRAVTERQRIHPAWWLAMVLAVALIVLSAWILLRPPAPSQPRSAAQLPLKVDFNLDVPRRQAPERHVQPEMVVPPASAAPATAETAPPVQSLLASSISTTGPAQTGVEPKASPTRPAASELPAKEKSSASASENPKAATAVRAVSVAESSASPDSVLPIPISKQIKELTPQQRAENEYRKAISLMQQGKAADAISGLEQALQLDPRHSSARQTLISLLLDGKRQDDALQMAREGLSVDPAQIGLAMILARLQVEKGDLSSAIGTLERALPYSAGRADYEAFLAALLQRDGKHKQASEHYLLALQKAPQNGVWWMGLGISYQAESRLAEAHESFKRAKATNTLSPELLAFVESRLSQLQR